MKLYVYRVVVPDSEDRDFRELIRTHNFTKPAISNIMIEMDGEIGSEVTE
jgi:hypothetical protein